MIASNYRRFPEAMALQLVLVFGRPVWNTSRPSSRIGRALRYAQAALVKATPQLVTWHKKPTPAWYLAARRAAKALANQVRQALDMFVWDQAPEEPAKRKSCTPGRVYIGTKGKPTRCGLEWCEESNWDGIKCRAAFCGLKGPKGGYL